MLPVSHVMVSRFESESQDPHQDSPHIKMEYTDITIDKKIPDLIVPLTPLRTYTGPGVIMENIPDVLEAHNIIIDSKLPNYLGCRIPVAGELKS